MRREFVEYLISESVVPESASENLRDLVRGAPEPIGSLAFKYGMITGADIDLVLDEQRKSHRPFGEIAKNLGLLTRTQVQGLLRIQQLRSATEIAEALALSGVSSIEELVPALGRFLIVLQEAPIEANT